MRIKLEVVAIKATIDSVETIWDVHSGQNWNIDVALMKTAGKTVVNSDMGQSMFFVKYTSHNKLAFMNTHIDVVDLGQDVFLINWSSETALLYCARTGDLYMQTDPQEWIYSVY